jgi:hypothetical protein
LFKSSLQASQATDALVVKENLRHLAGVWVGKQERLAHCGVVKIAFDKEQALGLEQLFGRHAVRATRLGVDKYVHFNSSIAISDIARLS